MKAVGSARDKGRRWNWSSTLLDSPWTRLTGNAQ